MSASSDPLAALKQEEAQIQTDISALQQILAAVQASNAAVLAYLTKVLGGANPNGTVSISVTDLAAQVQALTAVDGNIQAVTTALGTVNTADTAAEPATSTPAAQAETAVPPKTA